MSRIEPPEKWRCRRKRLSTTVLVLWTVVIALSLKPPSLHVSAHESQVVLDDEGPMPELRRAVRWGNVLVNFWTYSSIKSIRELPYLTNWAAKYKNSGRVVIGVHTPKVGFEKLGISFPVAIDSNRVIRQAFHNENWTEDYLIDAKGRIRYQHLGEGDYDKSEHAIQTLLKEIGVAPASWNPVSTSAGKSEARPSEGNRSPESYLGDRAEPFASLQRLDVNSRETCSPPAILCLASARK